MDLTFTQQLQQFSSTHTIMVIAWLALLIAVMVSFYKGVVSKVKIVDNAEATQLLNKADAVIIDLRTDDEYSKGHIIHSVHLLPSDIKSNNLKTIEKYKEKPVILVCTSGFTAASSADLLVKKGFTKVYRLKEGITGWRTANLPLVKKHK